MSIESRYRLTLLGPAALHAPDGARISLSSKKGVALIALLAMSSEGERSRVWLQSKLWGSRDPSQGQASLRRELSNLKLALGAHADILTVERTRVALDLNRVQVDARELEAALRDRPGTAMVAFGEFLEGLDLVGEEEFEDWLRVQRELIHDLSTEAKRTALQLDGRSPAPAPPPIQEGLAPFTPDSFDDPVPEEAAGAGTTEFPDRAALAVLPIENLTGLTEHDYLAEGIAEDLIERLSRLRWLPVIARSSSFALRDTKLSLKRVGEALGARYVVDGRLRSTEQGFGLSTSISDVETGYVLWSTRSELPRDNLRQRIEDFLTEVTAFLENSIDHVEQVRASTKPHYGMNVSDLIWRARWHLNRYTRVDGEIAERLLTEAVAREPESSEALVQLANCLVLSIWTGRKGQDETIELRQIAQRAINADLEDGRAYLYAGIAELWLKNTDQAKLLLRRAIELNPSQPMAYAQLAAAHYLSGEPATALELQRTSLRLGPNDQFTYFVMGDHAFANCMLGNWQEAIRFADQALTRRRGYWFAYLAKITALARSGRTKESATVLAELYTVKPDFSADYLRWQPFTVEAWRDYFRQGLAIAETALQAGDATATEGGIGLRIVGGNA